jgi:hypothetical protein
MITRIRLPGPAKVPGPLQKISHTVVSHRSAPSKILVVVAVKLPGRPQNKNKNIEMRQANQLKAWRKKSVLNRSAGLLFRHSPYFLE